MNSQARQYILGENRPKYQSFINWVGVYTSEEKLFDSMDIVAKGMARGVVLG